MQGNARYAQESDQCKWTKVDGISMIFIRDYIPWNKQTNKQTNTLEDVDFPLEYEVRQSRSRKRRV